MMAAVFTSKAMKERAMKRLIIPALALVMLVVGIQRLVAQQAPAPLVKANSEMAAAALKWWNTLSPDQQGKAMFDFKSEERKTWAFTPVPRKGLPWKDMTPMQRDLGHELV